MEMVLAVFLGVWISTAGILAHIWLKKEFAPYLNKGIEQEGATNE